MQLSYSLLLLPLGATIAAASGVTFGPAECVSLSRSAAGTCVLDTNCEGQDLSKVDFTFGCKTGGRTVTHSFGVGSFDTSETFDTDVNCDQCLLIALPTFTRHVSALVQVETAVARASSSMDADAVSYGPNGCVSTHRSSEGRCIMKTQCESEDIDSYEFGLICIDSVGLKVRHLFGEASFGSNETFDTLIQCQQCLALDDGMNQSANKQNRTNQTGSSNASTVYETLVDQIATLGKEVKGLKDMVTNVTKNVAKLNTAVFTTAAPDNDTTTQATASLLATNRHGFRHRMQKAEDLDDVSEQEDSTKAPYVVHRHLRHTQIVQRKHHHVHQPVLAQVAYTGRRHKKLNVRSTSNLRTAEHKRHKHSRRDSMDLLQKSEKGADDTAAGDDAGAEESTADDAEDTDATDSADDESVPAPLEASSDEEEESDTVDVEAASTIAAASGPRPEVASDSSDPNNDDVDVQRSMDTEEETEGQEWDVAESGGKSDEQQPQQQLQKQQQQDDGDDEEGGDDR